MHDVHTAELHTSDRLLLEAVREVNLFDPARIRTGDPRSDILQVQDFTTELHVLELNFGTGTNLILQFAEAVIMQVCT